MPQVEIVVVGAGIAGLAAAWELQRAGREVVVLEAAGRPGGRMCSVVHQGCVIDAGAQFLSSGYRVVPALAQAVGLQLQPIVAARNAVWHQGRWRALHTARGGDALRRGLLGPLQALRLAAALWPHRRLLAEGDLADYSRWAAPDDTGTADWLRRAGAQAALERVVEPMLQGLYFQDAASTSRALALMVAAFSWRRHHGMALPGGMGTLPQALAARLDVRCGVTVRHIGRDGAGARVRADGAVWQARHVICAVPAPQARLLWPEAPPLERRLLDTAYSASVTIALVLDAGWQPPRELQDVYGAVMPRAGRATVAALTIERHKLPDRAPGAALVHLMLGHDAARACMDQSDERIVDGRCAEIEALLPGALAAMRSRAVFRWPLAEPCSPPGRAAALARYRDPLRVREPVLLSGDALGAPTTEGAAESGLWAAARVLQGELA